MSAYLGLVSAVDADARRVQVTLPHLRALTPFLRFGSMPGLIAALPAVGDEVLVVLTGPGLADAVVAQWFPTSAQVAAAADRPLVLSTTGSVPTQVDPVQPIQGADVAGVLVR